MSETLSREQARAGESERTISDYLIRVFTFARRKAITRWAELLCIGLLLLMTANMLGQISRKSITNDESVHIPAGYYHLVAGNFQLNNEHPPLVKMLAALPLMLIQPVEPPLEPHSSETGFARTFNAFEKFWRANPASAEAIMFWTRASMILLAASLGALIFIYTRKLFNRRAALFAVALYSFEPTVLAHGRVVHTDLPAALAFLLFVYALHNYMDAPDNLRRALQLGTVSGLALVTKFSLIIIVPALFLVALVLIWRAPRRRRAKTFAHLGIVALVALLVINAVYFFHDRPLEAADAAWIATKSPSHFAEVIGLLRVFSNVAPTYFLFGIYNVIVHNQYGHPASLLGAYSDAGWWYYFPIAFALKTTLPFLLITIAASLWAVWQAIKKQGAARRQMLFVLTPLALYLVVAMTSNINIGIRHLLPAFPFLFVLGGALLDSLMEDRAYRMATKLIVAGLLCWTAIVTARAYPDYISYTNELTPHPHWQYLSDSNVEWGDDVGAVAEYLRSRGERRVRAAVSAGWATFSLYGIETVDIIAPPDPARRGALPDTRYVAIGASYLNGSTVPVEVGDRRLSEEERRNMFAAYRERTPEAVFGNSIYLYRVNE